MTDFSEKISNINNKGTWNITKKVKVEKKVNDHVNLLYKTNKWASFSSLLLQDKSSLFGKHYFDDDASYNYLVFRPLYRLLNYVVSYML